jgi:signal recognition particle GTPase
MTPQNLAFINATHPGDNVNFRTKLKNLVHNQCGNLSAYQRENMQRIMREEWFGPGYSTDLWCPSCVMSMAKIMHEQVEKYFAEEERKAKAKEELERKMKEAEILLKAVEALGDELAKQEAEEQEEALMDEAIINDKEAQEIVGELNNIAANFPKHDGPAEPLPKPKRKKK